MKRLVGLVLSLLLLAGIVYAYKSGAFASLLSKGNGEKKSAQSNTSSSPFGDVLGNQVQEVLEKPTLQEKLETAGGKLSDWKDTTLDVSEETLDKARYDYCLQVIEEYKQKTASPSASPTQE